MRQVIEILRLKHEHHLSIREIARSCGLASSTVGDYLLRAEAAALEWPLPEGVGEAELEARLSAVAPPRTTQTPPPPLPDWAHLHAELRRPNVTLRLLWQEYIRSDPSGLKYSRFCERYQQWRKTLEPTLRQVHVPGEKLFVDWAGQTVPIQNAADGTTEPASVFVAALGTSGKIYAEAFADQKLASWITAHVHAYGFYGGVPAITVPDNTRTAVNEACRYEPLLHRTYQEMAEHYGTVIVPTRVRKPRDKARAESAVQVAQRQILAALRDVVFFSVGELNQAIRPRLAQLNAQPFQKLEGSRQQWFQTLDQPKLRPLPPAPFVVATWLEATVNIDYHVVVEHHYYSVPYGLIHQRLDVRLTDHGVELFHKGKRVAAHVRSHQRGKFTTLKQWSRITLLLIDDLGLAAAGAKPYRELLEIIDDRQGKGSVVITSQFPVAQWHELVGDATVADALMDRLVHQAYRLELKGESMRKGRAVPGDGNGTPSDRPSDA